MYHIAKGLYQAFFPSMCTLVRSPVGEVHTWQRYSPLTSPATRTTKYNYEKLSKGEHLCDVLQYLVYWSHVARVQSQKLG